MDHFGPFWPEEVYFGPFRSANRTLVTPENRGDRFARFFFWAERPLSLKGRRPTQKATHPNKNSLHKQFAQTLLSVFCLFSREKGDSLYKLSRNGLRKLFVKTVFFFGVGGFLGYEADYPLEAPERPKNESHT